MTRSGVHGFTKHAGLTADSHVWQATFKVNLPGVCPVWRLCVFALLPPPNRPLMPLQPPCAGCVSELLLPLYLSASAAAQVSAYGSLLPLA